MTQPPPLPPPPFGADTDEALSALLDGELGAFAEERALTEEQARARLEAWPGYGAALDSLTGARMAIAEPVPPLDDVTRRRLVRTAVNAAPGDARAETRSRRSWVSITVAAAAALIVAVGIGVAISSAGDGGSEKQMSSGGSAAAPLRGDVGNLGDITSPAALRALLDRDAATSSTSAPGSASTANGYAQSSPTAPAEQGKRLSDSSAADRTAPEAAAAAKSPRSCAKQVAGSRPVTFVGTGTYAGAPVTIVGIPSHGRTVVFVVSSPDCTKVLTSISR